MSRIIRRYLPIFAIMAMAACPVGAQQRLHIIQVMGQFVQANHAASKCLSPDRDTLSRFLANFKVVTVRAFEEMRKRNPGMSEQEVLETVQKGGDAVARQIDEVLGAKGCSDPRIQDLLKRFEMQANLKL